MTGQIRKYKRENFDSVLQILESEVKKSHTFLSEEGLKKYNENSKNELCERKNTSYSVKIWLIYEEKKIVGFTSVREFSTETKIVSLYVLEAYQNKGYGKKLLKKVFSECKTPFRLAVFEENKNAYDFYIRVGFKIQEEGIEDNHKFLSMIKDDRVIL